VNSVSTGRVIKNDFAAFVMTIGGPIFLAISVFAAVFGFLPEVRGRGGQDIDPRAALALCAVAGFVTVLLFAMLARRISRIKRVLQTGPRALATVSEIDFIKDRGRVEFQYTYNGEAHHAGMAIMKNQQTEAIATGSEIEVALDPANPGKALIVQLYCTE
jgi:hypothetical protein